MGERSILSYFHSSNEANKAKEELAQMGYEILQVDRVSRYPGAEMSDSLYNPLTGEISRLSNLTLGTAVYDDAARLMSADPSVSGMAAEDVAGRFPFILTVVTESEKVDQAVQVVKKHGGYV